MLVRVGINLIRTAALAVICAILGCGIFDVKNPESPLPGSSPEDPLNIVDIIRSVFPEVLPVIDYGSYFTDDVAFYYYQIHPITGRREVVRMLENLRSRSSQSLRVEWQVERAERRWREGSLQYLDGVPYTVHSGGVLTHEGVADFRILIGFDYRINYWKDMPNGAPFFEP